MKTPLSLAGALLLVQTILTLPLTPSLQAQPAVQPGEGQVYAVAESPRAMVVADMNGDGRLDIITANQKAGGISILLEATDFTYPPRLRKDYVTGTGPRSLAVGDVNGDGRVDVAVANAESSDVALLLGDGTGAVQLANTPKLTPAGAGALARLMAVELLDINGDARLDLVLIDATASKVHLFTGDGTGAFTAGAQVLSVGKMPYGLTVGDINGDKSLDILVPNSGANSISVWLGSGTGKFVAAPDVQTSADPRSMALADFDGDGKMDIVTTSRGRNGVAVLLAADNGNFQPAKEFNTGADPRCVLTCDLDGNGKMDVAVVNSTDNNLSVLLGDGKGGLKKVPEGDYALGNRPCWLVQADINADKRPDLVAVKSGSNTVSVILG